MEKWTDRTELLLTSPQLKQLNKANVLVVGLGGVGAYAAEMIARAGVGRMTIIDGDRISTTNLNRQLLATHSALGKEKAYLMRDRLLAINPDIKLTVYQEFLRDERTLEVLTTQDYDYVVDAIDTLSPKLYLIIHSLSNGIPIISSMGAGGKKNPEKIHLADIAKTYNCRLAKTIRKRLHRQGIKKGLKTVFSSELQDKNAVQTTEEEQNKKSIVGTISYMPAIFGCMMAAQVIKDLCQIDPDQ